MNTLSSSEEQLLAQTIGGLIGHNIVGIPLYLVGRWLSKDYKVGGIICYVLSLLFEGFGLINSLVPKITSIDSDGLPIRQSNLASALICITFIVLDVVGLEALSTNNKVNNSARKKHIRKTTEDNLPTEYQNYNYNILSYDKLADDIFSICEEYMQRVSNVFTRAGLNPYINNGINLSTALATALYEYSVVIVRKKLKTKYKGKKALYESEDNRMIESFAERLMISPVELQKVASRTNAKEWKSKLTTEASGAGLSADSYLERIQNTIDIAFGDATIYKTMTDDGRKVVLLNKGEEYSEFGEFIADIVRISSSYSDKVLKRILDERGRESKPMAVVISCDRLETLCRYGAMLARRGLKLKYGKTSSYQKIDKEFVKVFAEMMTKEPGAFLDEISKDTPSTLRKSLSAKNLSYPIMPAKKYFNQIDDLIVEVFGVEVVSLIE